MLVELFDPAFNISDAEFNGLAATSCEPIGAFLHERRSTLLRDADGSRLAAQIICSNATRLIRACCG